MLSVLNAIPYACKAAKNTVAYLVYWLIFFLPLSPSFLRFSKFLETTDSNWIIIDEVIYGITASENTDILPKDPPDNIFNIPKIPFEFSEVM